MSVGVLFPGQGSQFVGMGGDLFAAGSGALDDRADARLGWSLRSLGRQGPEEELTRTEHAQPALFAVSYGLWERFRDGFDGHIAGAAGHSLGEYTALAASGVMGYLDALGVVADRGRAMAAAADLEPSGMAALIGADAALAASVATTRRQEGGRLQVANLNAPGQVVVAGAAADIDWVAENAGELGVRRVIPLKVAGAFHSDFMLPAAAAVRVALARITLGDGDFPVWSNTTARPHDVDDLTDTLVAQVVSTVRFEESLHDMAAAGIDNFVHIGPGDVTAGMAKRTLEGVTVHVVSTLADIPAVVTALSSID